MRKLTPFKTLWRGCQRQYAGKHKAEESCFQSALGTYPARLRDDTRSLGTPFETKSFLGSSSASFLHSSLK